MSGSMLRGGAALLCSILLLAASAVQAAPRIVVFGDSLSAAYGIAERRGWVALLEQRLAREGLAYAVVNASISGETTSGGLSRLPKVLAEQRPALLILELGANDGLRGLPLSQMSNNLGAMIELAQRARARVLLVGTRLPPNYGAQYTLAYENAFAEIAKRYGVVLAPDLNRGIGERIDLFQSDRLHPSEAAQPLLLDNVWNALRPLLK